jgi:hypothetical protein
MERSLDDARPKREDKPDGADDRAQPTLKPPRVRIGEGAKNLSQRQEWFKRRSGSDK